MDMGAKQSAEAREAIKLLQQGLTVQETAKQANVSESTCWRLIKQLGIDYAKKRKQN